MRSDPAAPGGGARVAGESALNLWLRVSAALVGSLLAALALSVALALVLPLSRDGRFAAGFFLMVPLWVAGMCGGFLARSGARAWGGFLATAAALGGLVWLLR